MRMPRRDMTMTVFGACVALCMQVVAHPAAAMQPGSSSAGNATNALPPDEVLENYLGERALWDVLAAYLRPRVTAGSSEEKLRCGTLLGKLYVRMLADATDPARRQEVESLARELIKNVPDAESFELRINLAKATYLRVEEIVERDRVRLATEADRGEADRVLRQTGPVFREIATKLDAKVQRLEKRETTTTDEDLDALRAELSESRRLRSLASYYSGWTDYYTALLSKAPAKAKDAMECFGVLLNGLPGKPASVERTPRDLLRYEHVARSVIGCAMCSSLLGNHEEAQRWLDLFAGVEQLPQGVKDQLLSRQMVVLAGAQRWSDVSFAVRRTTNPGMDETGRQLTIAEARLLSVLSLEAARDPNQRPLLKAQAEQLAQVGLAELVARGEIGHVTDLVTRYGTAPIGDSGFIAAYVRGVQAYEKARAAHQEVASKAGTPPDEPTKNVDLVNLYKQAAAVLEGATTDADAGRFGVQKARAGILRGLSFFYASDFVSAAEQFERAASHATQDKEKQDALWYAIVSLDRAIDSGVPSAISTRDRLATLFLQTFPMSENAARLLLRQARADKISDTEALDILLKVPDDSPLFFAARRQAAKLLYQMFRSSPSSGKDFAALKFAETGEQVLRLEQERALASRDETAREAAQAVIVRVRQLADALLGMTTPDVQRVETALEVLDGVAAYHGMELSQIGPELEYRRLQIAIVRSDELAIQRSADALRVSGGTYGAAADRLLFRRAQRDFKVRPSDAKLAQTVLIYGVRVLEGVPPDASDAASVNLRDTLAEAACVLWRSEADAGMRDLAIKLDKQQLACGKRTAPSLRRLGELLEIISERTESLEAWQELLLGLKQGTPEWFEARYESLRVLTILNSGEAAAVMQQHKVFYPEYGPAPWGEKLKQLDADIRSGSAPPAPPTPAGNGQQPPTGGAP